MTSPSWQLPAATGRLMVWKAACDGVEAGAQADVEMGEGRVHGGCDTAGARLGIAVTDWTRGGDENESSIQTDASMTEEGSSSDGNDADGSWRGLETAGIPKPGAWSRQRMSLATIRDGKIDYGTKDGKTDYSADYPVAGLYGAIDTALATVTVCLIPNQAMTSGMMRSAMVWLRTGAVWSIVL